MAGAVLRKGAAAMLALLLAAFFGFVGWNKAFAPLAELARHGAWTVHLPEWLGRLVGWSELALAAALVHLARGETAALPQNAVLIVILLALWGAARTQQGETA